MNVNSKLSTGRVHMYQGTMLCRYRIPRILGIHPQKKRFDTYPYRQNRHTSHFKNTLAPNYRDCNMKLKSIYVKPKYLVTIDNKASSETKKQCVC